MLIPIYKIGDVLVPKAKKDPEVTNIRDIWIFCAKYTEAKSADGKTEEFISYTAIVSVEHCEYMTLRDFDEMELVSDFKRIGHNDISKFIPEGDEQDKGKDEKEAQIKTLNEAAMSELEAKIKEKDEEIRKAREAIEFYKDQLRNHRKSFCILQDDNVKLIAENEKLAIRVKELRTCINDKTEEAESRSLFWKRAYDERGKVIDDLNDHLRIAYGCIDRFTIDAVAGMRRAGCSVEKIAKMLNMPEQAVRVYLNAADVLDCKEDE